MRRVVTPVRTGAKGDRGVESVFKFMLLWYLLFAGQASLEWRTGAADGLYCKLSASLAAQSLNSLRWGSVRRADGCIHV